MERHALTPPKLAFIVGALGGLVRRRNVARRGDGGFPAPSSVPSEVAQLSPSASRRPALSCQFLKHLPAHTLPDARLSFNTLARRRPGSGRSTAPRQLVFHIRDAPPVYRAVISRHPTVRMSLFGRPLVPCPNSPGSTKNHRSILPMYADRTMATRTSRTGTFWIGSFQPRSRRRLPEASVVLPPSASQITRRLWHVPRPPWAPPRAAFAHPVYPVGSADPRGAPAQAQSAPPTLGGLQHRLSRLRRP